VIILVPIGSVVANYERGTDTSSQTTNASAAYVGTYPVSTDQARAIALASAPGATMTGAPLLVSDQGTAVYEVTLDTGMVYVNATSGHVVPQIVTNTTPAATNPTRLTTTNGGQGGERDERGEDSN
jgi:hypothetical protein